MKHMKLSITFLALTAFVVGCKPSEEKSASQQIETAQEKTAEAVQDLNDYTYAHKAEFTATMENQLAELNRELDQLGAKIENSSDEVKAEARPRLDSLREQLARLNKELDEVRNATESTWESVKSGFKIAYESSKDGFNDARQWVSDKIAP